MPAKEQQLYFLLQLSAHALRKKADVALTEAAGLSTAQAAVLAVLVRDGPTTQKEVSRQLMQRESALTTMVTRLQKAGFVDRKSSEQDARAWTLQATANGQAALKNAAAPFAKINEIMGECFSPSEIDTMAAGLSLLVERLSD